VISSEQRPLPDNTQHSQETGIHAPESFQLTIPARQWLQANKLYRRANINLYTSVKSLAYGKGLCKIDVTPANWKFFKDNHVEQYDALNRIKIRTVQWGNLEARYQFCQQTWILTSLPGNILHDRITIVSLHKEIFCVHCDLPQLNMNER
jgi:hypothetical protein